MQVDPLGIEPSSSGCKPDVFSKLNYEPMSGLKDLNLHLLIGNQRHNLYTKTAKQSAKGWIRTTRAFTSVLQTDLAACYETTRAKGADRWS